MSVEKRSQMVRRFNFIVEVSSSFSTVPTFWLIEKIFLCYR